jgi:hypothetical protein
LSCKAAASPEAVSKLGVTISLRRCATRLTFCRAKTRADERHPRHASPSHLANPRLRGHVIPVCGGPDRNEDQAPSCHRRRGTATTPRRQAPAETSQEGTAASSQPALICRHRPAPFRILGVELSQTAWRRGERATTSHRHELPTLRSRHRMESALPRREHPASHPRAPAHSVLASHLDRAPSVPGLRHQSRPCPPPLLRARAMPGVRRGPAAHHLSRALPLGRPPAAAEGTRIR